MRTQVLIATAAAAALLASAAHAQSDTAVNPPSPPAMAMPAPTQAAPPADPAAAPGAPPAAGTVSIVTNGPVPDTAENRAKYGQPTSHAGRASKPAGN